MTAHATATIEDLRTIDLFEGVDDETLQRWADATEVRELPDGEVVAEVGQEGHGLQLILTGRLRVYSVGEDGRHEPEGDQLAPTWIGAIPTLTGGWHKVQMVCAGDVRVARIGREPFVELVLQTRPVFDLLMRTVRPVVSKAAQREANRERLAALGTMAAGLAHELNNPAAAAKRAAADLAETLVTFETFVGKLVEAGVERGEAAKVVHLKDELLERSRECEEKSTLEAADAEDELLDRLEELGVSNAWRVVGPLAAACADDDWLTRTATVAGDVLDEVIMWVAASLQAHTLADELAESTDRMSELVRAVKSYAYMDRGEVVQADVHEGIVTTLMVLKHKWKHQSIALEKSFDKTLPRITMYGSELNQVWTNLIDNAIDAIGESGTMTITTRRDGDCIVVDVGDDGPGMPPEVARRIFDPFFTTKEVGSGTGLGLDVARRIVVNRHGGSISVDSEPGRTVFHVWLPIDQKKKLAK
ncbi:ATP-binding protein [Conexibacter sp. JD483]|uniref:ATP-binding protein n=1 Tax=unclassified Conexibacter TaxID=2627773 RepID=UPI0027187F58|nr:MULTISPECIES: ATP-binding protein [unclassified Conexibacter]MDO8189530.1 ATP-binding protein [Conexibacter sp. CPCC 205706]MDO8201760.1 ATP-binding protein [Conexibacter sp. CPCC 205762]MDR9372832.1 ATP-binding protein [Conexibacter sp. JD483]